VKLENNLININKMNVEEFYNESEYSKIDFGSNPTLFTKKELLDFANEYLEAITVTRCCESVKGKYTHTFEVDLNSEKRKEQYNKHIEQIHNAPCKVYLYDGDKYIELKP
jgi:SAM-dependent MidA family methyltransferase